MVDDDFQGDYLEYGLMQFATGATLPLSDACKNQLRRHYAPSARWLERNPDRQYGCRGIGT